VTRTPEGWPSRRETGGTESGLQACSAAVRTHGDMAIRIWRIGAAAVIAAAIVFVIGQRFIGAPQGDYGINISPASYGFTITSVEPGSAAARDGLRAGESVQPAVYDARTQAALLYPLTGTRSTLRILPSGRIVTLTAHHGSGNAIPPLLTALKLAFLVVALLLAWRCPNDRSVRSLAYFLAATGFALALPSSNPVGSPMLSYGLFFAGSLCLLVTGAAAAADFAAHFLGHARPVPARLAALALGFATVGVAGVAAILVSPPSSAANARSWGTVIGAAIASVFVLTIATLVVGYAQSTHQERQKRRWILLIFGLGLAGPAIDLLTQVFFGFNPLLDHVAALTLVVIPIGLAYVILRHKVIDIGFVLNRAAVYAGVSIIVVGAFVIVETVLSRYVERTSHLTSTAVQLAVALTLGFSIRAIHLQVDRFVDRVLFRERHEAEASLRTFAHDAAYITDADVLLRRTIDAVLVHARAQRAGIWLADGAGSYAMRAGTFESENKLSENDPALVAMRARRIVVEPQAVGSSLPGALAFPMAIRGELLGVLVCDVKRDESAYAPDERAVLEELAASVGHAWDGLLIRELRQALLRRNADTSTLAPAT
jgi:hypothetical protein